MSANRIPAGPWRICSDHGMRRVVADGIGTESICVVHDYGSPSGKARIESVANALRAVPDMLAALQAQERADRLRQDWTWQDDPRQLADANESARTLRRAALAKAGAT